MSDGQPADGLRERKKAKTRAAIQQHALRLFQVKGYTATTVEEIAEAAEVSPSTFFRYFPTKEDIILYDINGPNPDRGDPDLTPRDEAHCCHAGRILPGVWQNAGQRMGAGARV